MTMAWDVGIKNLAYCVLDSDARVKAWEIINISGHVKMICCGVNKSGKKCNKAASLYLDEEHGYCKTHSSQSEQVWNNSILESQFEDCDGVCEYETAKGAKCHGKAKKQSDIKYCTTHYKAALKRMTKVNGLKPVKSLVEGKLPTQDLQINLFKMLDSRLDNFIAIGVKAIYIENQPSYVNPKMKALACAIMDYFLIRQLDQKIVLSTIQFISPSAKLALIPNAKATIKESKDKYATTKRLTIEHTIKCLNEQELEIFNGFKPKQDDAADAYLFAYGKVTI